jgi:hypothetical protein
MRELRRSLHLLLALFACGCGARSTLPAPSAGAGGSGGTPDIGSLVLTQGTLSRQVAPLERDGDVVSFYSYTSSSGHTGFEALGKSQLLLYRDTTAGVVSLVTEHGIDIDATGMSQPESQVNQHFTGLPAGVTIALADDDPSEFFMPSDATAEGKWHFHQNTDGGVLSGLPLPGSWSIAVSSEFLSGIDSWRFIDESGEEIPLDLTETVTLTASE